MGWIPNYDNTELMNEFDEFGVRDCFGIFFVIHNRQ